MSASEAAEPPERGGDLVQEPPKVRELQRHRLDGERDFLVDLIP